MSNHLAQDIASDTTQQGLSGFEWGLLFLGLILILVIGLALILFIIRRYPSGKGRTHWLISALFQSLIIPLVVFLLHLTLTTFGLADKELLEESLKWYIVAWLVLFGILIIGNLLARKRAIPTTVLWEKYVKPDIERLFGGTDYVGSAVIYPFLESKTMPSSYAAEMTDEGIPETIVEAFLVQVYHTNMFQVLEVRDKFTGEGLHHKMDPPNALLHGIFGKDSVRSTADDRDTRPQQPDKRSGGSE